MARVFASSVSRIGRGLPVGVVGVVGLFVCACIGGGCSYPVAVCVSTLRAVAVSGRLYRCQAFGLSNKFSKKNLGSFEQVFETSVR